MVSSGPTEWGRVEDLHGHNMFWSHYGPEQTRDLIERAGFEVIYAEILEHQGERHYWVLGRKRKSLQMEN